MNFAQETAVRLGVTIRKRFTAGHQTPEVHLVESRSGELLVLKLGDSTRTIAEIQKNLRGYERLRAVGLESIAPSIKACDVQEGAAYILMEYCGHDFTDAARASTEPVTMYRHLSDAMSSVYERSIQVETPTRGLRSAYDVAVQQYSEHLKSVFDPAGEIADLLEQARSDISFPITRVCFSSWDFTPRNVCLVPNGVKYIDPNEDILGIPLVDLACFAGVVRDVEHLPGADEGYKCLELLATKTGALLNLSKSESTRAFYLGRVLQCFLSSRFRISQNTPLALQYLEMGRGYLKKIIST